MTTITASRRVIDGGRRLDADQGPRIRAEAAAAWEVGGSVIVDVRRVEYMDMAGLSALAWILVQCRRRDHGAYLLGPLPDPVSRFLELTTFDRFFQIRLIP